MAMKSLRFKVAMAALVGISWGTTAVGEVKDLTVNAGETTTMNATSDPGGALLKTVVVNGTLVVDGISVTNNFPSGAASGSPSLAIGNDPSASEPAKLIVTNAPGGYVGGYVHKIQPVTIGANGGKGGTIYLHGKNAKSWGWGSQFDWGNGMGQSYNGNSGTFGGPGAYLTLSADVQNLGNGVLDILWLGPNGCYAGNYIANNSTAVKARILFDGGRLWAGSSGTAFFNIAQNAEIELASVNGNDIYIWSLTHITLLSSGTKGTLSTSGTGNLYFGQADGGVLLYVYLPSGINWGHAGNTYLEGRYHFQVTGDDALPYGSATKDVYLGQCIKNLGGADSTEKGFCWLNLQGHTVRVNGLHISPTKSATADYVCLTNTSATTATLIFGDKKEGEETYPDGVFEANNVQSRIAAAGINYKKVGDGTLTLKKIPYLDNFTVEGGKFALTSADIRFGTLTMAEGTTLVADGCTIDPAVLSENLMLTGVNYESKSGGSIVVSNGDGTVDIVASVGTISLASVSEPIRTLTISGAGAVTLQGRAGQTIQNLDVGECIVTATAAFEIANLTVPQAGAFVAKGVDVKVAAVNAERGKIYGETKGAVVVPRQDGGLDVYVGTPEYAGGRFGGKEVHLIKEREGELAFVTGCDEAYLDVQAGTVRFDSSANCNIGALTLADGVTVSVTGGAKLRVETISDADAAKITTSGGGLFLRTIDGILYPIYVTVVASETDVADATFTRYDAPNGEAKGTYVGIEAVLDECAYATLVKEGAGQLNVTASIQRFTGDFIVKAGVYYTDCPYGIGGVGARTFIKSGATMVSDGIKETLDLHAGGKLYIEGTGATGMNGVAFEMRSPAVKVSVDYRITSAATYLKYAGNGGITLTGDATITTTKDAGTYYTGRMGTVDFGGHTLTIKAVKNYPELTPADLVVKNPGNLVMQDAAFITTGIDESFKKGSADNRIVRKGNYWQIAGADCSAVPWTFEMGSGTYFQFEGLKLYKSIATWGGPMVLSGDVKTFKISSAITGSTERNQNWLVFTNVVTGAGGIVNNIAATATDLNYMGGGVRLANPNNSFAGAIKLNRTELDLDASGALPKDGMGAGLRDCRLVLKEGVDYELPGCSIYNTGVVTNGTGKWTQPFVKYEDGKLDYASDVAFSSLEVKGGTIDFGGRALAADNLVGYPSAGIVNCPTLNLGGWTIDGAVLTAATDKFTTSGKIVFAEGATITIENPKTYRSNRGAVTIATAAGGIEGLPTIANPLPKREYRLYVDGNDLKLECQAGMVIMVR